MKISSGLLTGIFVIALFILLFFTGIAYRQMQSLKASERLISHSYDVNLELVKLFSSLKDTESGQRGFMLTKDSMYFRQYISSWMAAQNSMDRLKVLVKGVKSQETTLDTLFNLITLRKSTLEISMQLADGKVIVPESVVQNMNEGSQEMEMIRTQINSMTANEKELLAIWKNTYKKDINVAPITYLIVILFAILIFIFSFYKISQDRTELQKANNDYLVMNEQLMFKNTELKKSEDRYHLMVSEVQDYAIILLNNEGIIQNWNKGAEKIMGYSEEEIIGKPISVFYSKEDIARKLPEQLLKEATINGKATHAGWRIRKDGSRFWGNVAITTLRDEDNNVIGFTKVTRDLTSQKEAEERLLEYNRSIEKKNIELLASNEEIASFNHIASHDLQEPLRKIQTFISRITRENSEHISEKGKEYFARISTSAGRMQQLIDDLITYTHTNRADKVFIRTDLNSLISSVLDEFKPTIEEKKAVIRTEHLPTLSVIPFQFEQLFTNLIDNSLKYSRQNVSPVITITSSIVDAHKVPGATLTNPKKFHRITISDNGIGFENQYADTIFTLFQRLHGKSEYSGTGIGLAICKKIVENHNGIISAESIPNEGSQFHIFIPVEV
ncbi:MAG: PAS domain S-box protein [Saprospiraceae bacterium]|uniref:histidine kinase n=1 Tax=Candidatus Opimibacter skivensis TaxID=2982028 RepID=A0A9D7SW20_9BACT|nr:PAS domain S-box protein [Candidatus Opimibacter skivensis]